jgi:hypothetical protein
MLAVLVAGLLFGFVVWLQSLHLPKPMRLLLLTVRLSLKVLAVAAVVWTIGQELARRRQRGTEPQM